MNGLTPEEKRIALNAAFNGADLMYIPSVELCSSIVQGNPKAKGINDVMTAILLKREPIRLDSRMIIQYCRGTLDENNTWLFDNGDIKIVPPRFKKPVNLKPEEEKEFFKKAPKIENEDGQLTIEQTKKEENDND